MTNAKKVAVPTVMGSLPFRPFSRAVTALIYDDAPMENPSERTLERPRMRMTRGASPPPRAPAMMENVVIIPSMLP